MKKKEVSAREEGRGREGGGEERIKKNRNKEEGEEGREERERKGGGEKRKRGE